MRIVKIMPVLMILLSVLVVATAQAAPGKSVRQSPVVQTPIVRDLIIESEPNDNCAMADPVSPGDLVNAAIDPEGDRDFFELTLTEGAGLYIHTILGESVSDLGDSELYLYADDCITELAYSDDSVGYESAIIHAFPGAGTYYIMIMGYEDERDGTYELAIEEIEFMPIGETCEEATSIPNGEFTYTATTTGMSDDYTLGSHGIEAPDMVFGFTLPPTMTFSCQMEAIGADLVIYLVTDCSDPESYMVDGSDDDPEFINYTNETGETQYLYHIIDGYGAGDHGGFIMTGVNEGSGLVAATPMSWGEVKALYR